MAKSITRIQHDEKLIPILKTKNYETVLDVGSKDGRYKQYIKSKTFETLDIESEYKPDITGDIEFYTSDKKYDAILCTQVLEHVKHPEIAIKNINNLLKKGGELILTIPFIHQEHAEEDYWRWTDKGIHLLLKTYGYNQIKITPYGNWITSSWNIFNFHNKFGILNKIMAKISNKVLFNKICPHGYIIECKKC